MSPSEKPIDIDTDVDDIPLDVQSPGPLAKREKEAGIVAFESFKRIQAAAKQIFAACVSETKPQDWISMGKAVYLQAIGAERLQKFLGLVWSPVEVTREDFADGSFAYIVTGQIGSRLYGTTFPNEGSRWSGDPFFDEFNEPKPNNWREMPQKEQDEWKQEHRLPVPPNEVRKAANANYRVRGITMMAGLRGLTVEDLQKAGVDTGKIQGISFGQGTQGGKARTDRAPEKFGPAADRGKPVSEISDSGLEFYIKASLKELQDPAKAKFHAHNQAWMETCMAEVDRRKKDKESVDGADPDGHYPG